MFTGGIDPVDSVTLGNLGCGALPNEKIRSLDSSEGLGGLDQGGRLCAGQEHADHCPVALEVPAENLERVVVTRLDNALQGFRNLGGVLCRGCHSEVFPSLSALDVAYRRRCHGNRSISRGRAPSLRTSGRRARQARGSRRDRRPLGRRGRNATAGQCTDASDRLDVNIRGTTLTPSPRRQQEDLCPKQIPGSSAA